MAKNPFYNSLITKSLEKGNSCLRYFSENLVVSQTFTGGIQKTLLYIL